MNKNQKILRNIRIWIIVFIISLALSGITAFAVETELGWLLTKISPTSSTIYSWLAYTYTAVKMTNLNYPILSYGTDWLAFAHLVIATVFIGPLIDPVRNIWVIQFGCIACITVFPLAFIAGHIRHIPIFWQLIDCSFGLIGIVPLLRCYKMTRILEKQINLTA